MTDPQPIATWRLGRHVGREVRIFDTLESTNSLAIALADDPANAGLAIVAARSQSAGRGQYGRTWSAPVGSSVLLSAIVFPPPALRPPAILTSWAAVAVCELLNELLVGERWGLSPPEATSDRTYPVGINPTARHEITIKWPNDVLLGGKKVAGILIEQRTTAGVLAAVVGIGVNVRQSSADLAGLPDATSLSIAAGQQLDTEAVCRALIERLDIEYGRLLDGELPSLGERWQRRLQLVGKPVVVECIDRTLRGQLVEVGLCAVVVQIDGDLVHLTPETIRHVRFDVSVT